jgi:hypothetical protein
VYGVRVRVLCGVRVLSPCVRGVRVWLMPVRTRPREYGVCIRVRVCAGGGLHRDTHAQRDTGALTSQTHLYHSREALEDGRAFPLGQGPYKLSKKQE